MTKKKGFSPGTRFWVLVGILAVSIGLSVADNLSSRGIFKCFSCNMPHLGGGKSAPPTSVVAVQPNFHVVAPGIWRSAAVSPESLQRMKSYGLKTIVNLRLDGEAEPWENKVAAELGVQYFHFPLSASKIVPVKTIDAVLSILTDPKRQPALVHCSAGKDRTGMVIAAYRLSSMNWSFADIFQEMKMYGFNEVYRPLLTSLRFWSGTHGFLEAAQQIALVEKKLTEPKDPTLN